MKINNDQLLDKVTRLMSFIKRFRFMFAFAIFSLMYGYLIVQMNNISSREPNESQISSQTSSAPQTKIDPKLADKITSLEEENIEIKTIFNEARKNPFSE